MFLLLYVAATTRAMLMLHEGVNIEPMTCPGIHVVSLVCHGRLALEINVLRFSNQSEPLLMLLTLH
jgi:hypothetical protein